MQWTVLLFELSYFLVVSWMFVPMNLKHAKYELNVCNGYILPINDTYCPPGAFSKEYY